MTALAKNLFLFLFPIIFTLGLFTVTKSVKAYGECTQYGVMSYYDSLSDSCKCISGYVFSTGILGTPYCVSADQVCKDKYGFHAQSDYTGGSCKCNYGYSFGKDSIGRTQCISEDDQCHDQLGYSSHYNSLRDVCECTSGYIISGGRCQYGDTVCRNEHGLYSDYNSLSNKCECDSGYTFDSSNQCVKKQNNVYFYLKEIDTDNREAIIKSEYDYTYYLISYGIGCYSSSIKRYLHSDVVVNLGTDFDLDAWDKIVLQNDDEVCDITRVSRASSSDTLYPEEETNYSYVAPAPIKITPITNSQIPKIFSECQALTLDKNKFVSIPTNSHPALNSKVDIWECNEGYKESVNKCVKIEESQTTNSNSNLFVESVKSDESTTTVNQQIGIEQGKNNANIPAQKKDSKVKSFFKGFGNFFKKIGSWFKK